ncbi:YajG family lipoprotein [Thalassotalea agarivorans]|uniref:Uncharacterized lipoprotein n=1 Tax=Thalassotalea agarivorans TaxID=349064 RepID=A0A1H9YGK2_THASX|nr:YajG family lipoprotein [Thalassotalea agarivorans]SES67708.1 uncharacterized lipoprotein [Thalassotalea agarivorans]
MKKTLVLLAAALLAACATPVKHVIVAPLMMYTPSKVYLNKEASLTVSDARASKNVLTINKKDQATYLGSQEALDTIVERELRIGLSKKGLTLNGGANNSINVEIKQADTVVEQTMTDYVAKNEFNFLVTVKSGEKTLTKTFKINGENNGVLNADVAVMERDYNQNLGKIIARILQSAEIQQAIK